MAIWTEAERRAWSPPEKLSPSAWAERYRVLHPSVAAEAGPWRNGRTPYLRGLMDAFEEPGVEEVVFLKCVQIGGSEALRNVIGYWVDQDPGPCLIVMPDEQSAREAMTERIKPLLEESPALARHMSKRAWDNKATTINTDTMPIYVGWAGSPQRLASRPIRNLVLDEVDKYPPFSGKDAEPISLARERTTTYLHRKRIALISTPTTRQGNIWRAWESCGERRHYWVPCPHCDKYQTLEWARVTWTKPEALLNDAAALADWIETHDAAWVECSHCQGRIEDRHKPKMMLDGVWMPEDTTLDDSGKPVGSRVNAKRVGFHLNALYSPWVKIAAIAAEFLRSKGDPARMMSWRNNKLALPFEEQASATKPGLIEAKKKHAGPAMVVPRSLPLVLMTADVQSDHLWYVIRAWGHRYRSQLIRYGAVGDFEQLWQVFTQDLATDDGEVVHPLVCAIDARHRTDEVYQFAQRIPGQVWPLMGSSNLQAPPITEASVKGYQGVIRRTTNPGYWKDILHGRIHDDDETLWLPHSQVGDDYLRQLTSEHKIHDPHAGAWVWVPISSHAPNHLWDCEYMQCVAAQLCGVAALPEYQEQRKTPVESPREQGGGWVRSHKGRW